VGVLAGISKRKKYFANARQSEVTLNLW